MAKVERWICDQCGRSSNGEGPLNWVGMCHDAGVVSLPPTEPMPGRGGSLMGPPSLRVYTLRTGPRSVMSSEEQHFCGLACAMVKIQNELRQLLGLHMGVEQASPPEGALQRSAST